MADLVYNEQTKLLANALDRASTACVAVGIFTPLASIFLGDSAQFAGARSADVYRIVTSVVVYFLAGYTLHLQAVRALRGLRE